MTTYYWESENSFGQFKALNDKKAQRKAPKNIILLYKENNTKNGTPFVIILEK